MGDYWRPQEGPGRGQGQEGEGDVITLPDHEKARFDAHVRAYARQFDLTPEDYIRKVWYHENAARLGEYVAIVLVNELVQLAPMLNEKT